MDREAISHGGTKKIRCGNGMEQRLHCDRQTFTSRPYQVGFIFARAAVENLKRSPVLLLEFFQRVTIQYTSSCVPVFNSSTVA